MESIKSDILKIRKIKENSLNAYIIILKKLNNNQTFENLNFLKEKENIIKLIKEKALTTQRNYYSAILVALPIIKNSEELLKFYKEQLDKVNEEYNIYMNTHKKSKTQETNWATLKDLKKIFLKYNNEIKLNNYSNKENLNNKEFNFLTNYLIVALYTLIPPIRLDYAPMSIIENDSQDDDLNNYLVNKSKTKKYFIINEYKSSKTYGKVIIKIPPKLNVILNLYLKFHNKKKSFLLNTRGEYLNANALSKLITTSFNKYSGNKKITLNLLRHIYISENIEIKDEEQIKKEKELASTMMHSAEMQQQYVKV